MTFKLKVGDVCKLNEVIPSIYKKDAWKTGLYRVKNIWALGCYGKDKEDPRRQSYFFEKIRKDGTVYKSFRNGYRCQTWDKFIDEGKVTKI
jgi:hypothetical protein